MSDVTVSRDGIVTGNTYDKYGSHEPGRQAPDGRLRERARRALRARRAGVGARRRLRRGRARAPLGAEPPATRASSASTSRSSRSRPAGRERQAPNLEYRVMQAENLPFADGEFELASAIEVLEHVPGPGAHARRDGALREPPPARVGAARAAVADAEHGARRLLERARQHARPPQPLVEALVRAGCSRATARSSRCARRSPGRCCLSASRTRPAKPAREPAAKALIRQRRADPLDRDRLDRAADVRLLLDRQPRPRRSRGQARRPAVVGDVRDHLGDLPADRTAALAHDRRAPRARARAAPAARADADPGRLRAAVPGRSRWRSKNSCSTCSTTTKRSTGSSSSARSPTRRATSPAAGSPATSASGCSAASC